MRALISPRAVEIIPPLTLSDGKPTMPTKNIPDNAGDTGSNSYATRSRTGGWYLLNWCEKKIQLWKLSRILKQVPPLDDKELGEILDWGRMLKTSYLPLIEQIHGKDSDEFKDAKAVAEAATDCGRPWAEKHPTHFPEDPTRWQLIADRLESLETLFREQKQALDKLTNRRSSGAAAQTERRVS